ncbi:MAG: arginine deiminase-related protein [Candidatus Omnitrophota bacterium]|nr:arginine deiminase-related protein [Candidatus Omnitrophota bacterium]
MTLPRLLMSPPEYFDVVYEINPWMSVRRKVEKKHAVKQWENYHRLLVDQLKVKVEILDPVRGLPDMVFTANAGLVYKRLFVRSNFRHRERQGEEPYYEKWFKKKGYKVKTVDAPLNFEGEGDALFMGGELFAGFHFRTDVVAHEIISGYIKRPYFSLELCDKRFYHLDTCFAPVDDKTALVFMDAFEPYSRLGLLENIPDPIEVPEKEALNFACNAVILGQDVILPEGCPKTEDALKKRGFRSHSLDFTEFLKAGGAAKCLVLKL